MGRNGGKDIKIPKNDEDQLLQQDQTVFLASRAKISSTNKNEFTKNDSTRIPAHEYAFADATTINACRP
jgi:hypothetical protein